MGVKYLWDIIDEAKSIETLDCLRGKVLSVDLSIWIVEAIKTLQYKTSILKPHLRNIFYRVLCLRKLGIKLIFVTEGEAPDLKQNTMKQRNEQRYGVKSKTKIKVGRSRFQKTINECCHLLDLLGMPYVKAAGEAEAMCAVLSKHDFTDGCLTNDGDFFLYGGKQVYRDFGIDPKDPHVLRYTMDTIKERVGISQEDMIGLALLCGCDYTDGVPGVGKISVKKFLEERKFSQDLIQRMTQWFDSDFLRGCDVEKSEVTIARKAVKVENFLNEKIIEEYLIEKDRLGNIHQKFTWKYPKIKQLQEFLLTKLEWPFEYTLSKVYQLASSCYLEKLSDQTLDKVPITPSCVLKTRCQHGVSLVEIEWEHDTIKDVEATSKDWENCPETFVTLENQEVVLRVLPDLVQDFLKRKEEKNKKGSRSKKKKAETEEKINASQVITAEQEPRRLCDLSEEILTSESAAVVKNNADRNLSGLSDAERILSQCVVTKFKSTNSSDREQKLTDLSEQNTQLSEDSEDDTAPILPLSQRIARACRSQRNVLNQSENRDFSSQPRTACLQSDDVTRGENECVESSSTIKEKNRIKDAANEIYSVTSLSSVEQSNSLHAALVANSFLAADSFAKEAWNDKDATDDLFLCEEFNSLLTLDGTKKQPSVLANCHTTMEGTASFIASSQRMYDQHQCVDREPITTEDVNVTQSPLAPPQPIHLTPKKKGVDGKYTPLSEYRDSFITPAQKYCAQLKAKGKEKELDDTPICFDTSTPTICNATNDIIPDLMTLQKSSKKKISAAFTNFSDLGDSILTDSLELFDDPEQDANEATNVDLQSGKSDFVFPGQYESCSREQSNLSSKNERTELCDDDLTDCNETVEDTENNSPLCLADRLKLRLK